jgi:hypothetical protein
MVRPVIQGKLSSGVQIVMRERCVSGLRGSGVDLAS